MPRPALSRKRSRTFAGVAPVFVCALIATVVMALVVPFVFRSGSTLRFGDAEAHLNIARRILDSRTPGWGQVGTTWLPLPHLLMLPLVRIDALWKTGLAGAITSALAAVVAVTFLFAAFRSLFGVWPAAAGAAVFLLNPNVLYLCSIPMTEAVFFGALFGLLYFTVRFRDSQSWIAIGCAGITALAGTLTRYEAWFVLPFAAAYILGVGGEKRWAKAFTFCAIAGIGPVIWFVHNWWYFDDALDFYRGPYSPMAIQRHLDYPGKNNWTLALRYYLTAGKLVCGVPALVIACVGFVAALFRKVSWWPATLLLLPPVFYVWGMHSSGGSPIHVPTLSPFSYYNTRYSVALLPLAALSCAVLSSLWKTLAPVLVLIALSPFLLHPWTPPLVWKESDVNSQARLQWTRSAAAFLQQNAAVHDTYFTSFGDLTGIYRTAGIPLRRTLTGDIQPQYLFAETRPDLFLHEDWAVIMGGDAVQAVIDRARLKGPRYDLATRIVVPGAPVIEIYRRTDSTIAVHADSLR